MQGIATKVVINTIILYSKIVITMLISLITVPMVLNALGDSDYGLYNLIAGIIGMLSFLNASMTIATQRYLSVAVGQNNLIKLNEIFNNSIILHIIIGIILVLIFEGAALFIFDGFLNISPDKILTAKFVYQFLVISTFFTILTVPYNAIMNAKEDMLAFSLIGIFDSFARLIIAFIITKLNCDRLLLYAFLIAILTIIVTLISRFYIKIRYKEFTFRPKLYVHSTTLKEMFNFAGWNTLGAVAMIGRNQGVAILLNLFIGTVANAAYGVANQLNGVLSYFSSTFQKALNPQLMQSHGMNNHERLVRISCWASKYSVMILALFTVPLILEMPFILRVWLKDIPEYTIKFCQMILILSLVYQYSTGLMNAIQAVGNVRNYFIVMSLLIITNLPISYYILNNGYPAYYCIFVMIVIEAISFCTRLMMAKKLVGFPISLYIKNVLIPTLFTVFVSFLFGYVAHISFSETWIRLIVVCLVYAIVYILCSWICLIEEQHKSQIQTMIHKFRWNNYGC